jgi:hypothetical protein
MRLSANLRSSLTIYHPHPEQITRVAYYLNGTFLGASNHPPFSLSIMPTAVGATTVRAVAESQNFGTTEDTVVFRVR